MKSFERGRERESLDAQIISVARAYGFTNPPVSVTRKDANDIPEGLDKDTGFIATVAGKMGPVTQTTQAWGTARKGNGTAVVFTALSAKIAIAQAFVVKAALSVVEAAGFAETVVLISSVGDAESRRRYLRELGNFFKKYGKELPDDILSLALKHPEAAATTIVESGHPLTDSLPRTIDYLSEPSRKIMLETITLFEKLGIQYELDARLPYTPEVNQELVFAISGIDEKGTRVHVAKGGRFEYQGKKKDALELVGMSVSMPDVVDVRGTSTKQVPACFVVHVGEAAKLKAFTLLDSLWRAHITLGQALLAETIDEQMRHARESETKYVAIIGQREALDNTVIIKNTGTQMQETIPVSTLLNRMSRVRA
ncbi:MAG: His/Gly/Thr/Pro-type tRNA ligase C-terminal domain-containing protein [Patescibacteria group bacterium]